MHRLHTFSPIFRIASHAFCIACGHVSAGPGGGGPGPGGAGGDGGGLGGDGGGPGGGGPAVQKACSSASLQPAAVIVLLFVVMHVAQATMLFCRAAAQVLLSKVWHLPASTGGMWGAAAV